MKTFTLVILILALFFGISAQKAQAQSAITAQAFAEVIAALTANETSQLNFGKFVPPTDGFGQVIITTDGSRLSSGSVMLSGGTAPERGIFHLTGAPDASFSIQLPTGPALLTHQNSTKTMSVSDWVSTPTAGTGTGLLASGAQNVYVGATLQVGTLIDNPVGLYSGSYELTFAYN